MMSYPGPGPMIPEELRIKYTQGNKIGYYRVTGNDMIKWETEATWEEWEERKTWT